MPGLVGVKVKEPFLPKVVLVGVTLVGGDIEVVLVMRGLGAALRSDLEGAHSQVSARYAEAQR